MDYILSKVKGEKREYVNVRDEGGNSALMYAIDRRDIQKITRLLEEGANPQAMNDYGTNVLGMAYHSDYKEGIGILRKYLNALASQNIRIADPYFEHARL